MTGTFDGLLTVGFFDAEFDVEGEFFDADDVETGDRVPLLAVVGFFVGRRETGFFGAAAVVVVVS